MRQRHVTKREKEKNSEGSGLARLDHKLIHTEFFTKTNMWFCLVDIAAINYYIFITFFIGPITIQIFQSASVLFFFFVLFVNYIYFYRIDRLGVGVYIYKYLWEETLILSPKTKYYRTQ